MHTIWKFELRPDGRVTMPVGAKALSVAAVGNHIYLWAIVKPEAPPELRHFIILPTGFVLLDKELLTRKSRFLGTVLMHGGSLVWHVFEDIKENRGEPK